MIVFQTVALEYWSVLFFFFFQAEDGIRDLTVTGVQTCALPIYELIGRRELAEPRPGRPQRARITPGNDHARTGLEKLLGGGEADAAVAARDQIGRASCRERV